MKLVEGHLNDIVYTSESKGETTQRTIIPTFVPPKNIKAVDVTELPAVAQQEQLEAYKQYVDYKTHYMSDMLSFDQWCKLNAPDVQPIKWRTFAIDRIE